MAQKEIPCYLFVGMLESGKTKFIQETMEDPQFDSGDKTLLLICEEGEEEYDSERFAFGGVTVATIEDKADLNREHLQQLAEKSDCGRVGRKKRADMARNGKLVGREESKRPAWHILFQRKGCSFLRRMKKPRTASRRPGVGVA